MKLSEIIFLTFLTVSLTGCGKWLDVRPPKVRGHLYSVLPLGRGEGRCGYFVLSWGEVLLNGFCNVFFCLAKSRHFAPYFYKDMP